LTARDPKDRGRSASSIKAMSKFLTLDAADGKSIAQATETFEKESARLDVLVNNAGIIRQRFA
jgi:NADP-dependent 3-hydroxy acid dehydrogenase YdfG